MSSPDHNLDSLQKGWAALERREMHPLRVYRPMPQQEAFHRSAAEECLVVGGKRSGKTLSVAMEFGSRVLGMPIIGRDGHYIPLRYRTVTPKNPGLFWVIGFDIKHIGQTLYHRLFTPGLGCDFKIIYENSQKGWVAYNPNIPWHAENEHRAKQSPPLFSDRIIDPGSWHFESRAGNVFNSVQLTNGATLCAYASTGDHPKKGDAVDGIWLDEDIQNSDYLKEWYDRLWTRNGWFLWSIWPQGHNFAYMEAMKRAEKYKDEEDPPITVFRLVGSQNIYSDKEGIERGLDRIGDDDDVAHRDRGDIEGIMAELKMYEFAPAIHLVKPKPAVGPENIRDLFESILHRNAKFPAEWTRYLAIDPSHTRTACLFGVVPPQEWEGMNIGNRLIIERELVVKKHTPQMFADALLPLVLGTHFEVFIMDQQIGRAVSVGADVNVFDAYGREFAKRGIISRCSKSGFVKGCNDKRKRRNAVRALLECSIDDGWPGLFFDLRYTFQTQKEIYDYRKKHQETSDGRVVTDDAVNERKCDCMAALEYLVEHVTTRFENDTAYKPPELGVSKGSAAYQLAMKAIEKQNATTGDYVHFGPGAKP